MADADDQDDFDSDGDGDEFEFDCQMYSDGQCGAAGSEGCEFECPVMAAIRARQRPAL